MRGADDPENLRRPCIPSIFRGFLRLRVARLDGGAHIYEAVLNHDPLESFQRLRELVLAVASVLGPLPEKSLATTLGYVAYHAPALKGLRLLVPKLVDSGELASAFCRRHPLSLAREARTARPANSNGAISVAIRSARLGSCEIRASLGLAVPIRSICSRSEEAVWLLRHANALARRRRRVGKRIESSWEAPCRARFCEAYSPGTSL